jgi:predicted transcriptional regulator/fibronectin type 3 domain-containing protein
MANLSWDLPNYDGNWPIEGYRIYRGTVRGEETLYTEVPISNQFTNYGLINGQTYYYQVSAMNYIGEGERTDAVGCTPFGTPSSPQNFTATPGCLTAILEWDPPLDDGGLPIEGYHIYRKESDGTFLPRVTVYNNTSYQDMDVEIGKTYHYYIRAFHSLGNGTPSVIIIVSIIGPPSVPINFAVQTQDGSFTISWDPPLDLGGTELLAYRLYRGYDNDSLAHHIRLGPFTGSYTDTNVAMDVPYCYAVVAENAVGTSPMSPIICVRLTGPPGSPAGVDVTSGDGWVNLSWEPPTSSGGLPPLGSFVYRRIDEAPYVQLADVRDARWFNDTDVVNGETYHYTVSIYNEKGEGPRSTAVFATPAGVPLPPESITIVEGNGWLEIKWSPPSDTKGSPLTGYNIYRGTFLDDLIIIKTPGSRITNHTDSGLDVGVTYYYTMTSLTAVGEGSNSILVSGTPYGRPWEPRGMAAQGRVGSIEVSWSFPVNDGGRPIIGYVLYRGLQAGSLDDWFEVGTNTSYMDIDVEVGTTYHYAVAALNIAGEGVLSGEVMASPELPVYPPGPPRALDGELRDGAVVLSWSPPLEDGGADLTGYIVLRGINALELLEIAQLGNVLTYTDGAVKEGTTYHYAVAAVNAVGQGEMSETFSIEVKVAQGEEDGGVPIWLILVGIGIVILVGLGVVASTETGRFRLALLLVPLLTGKDEVLDNKTRYALHGIINEKPGIHYTALKDEFGLSNGAAAYHLEVLEKEDFIRSVRDGRLKRFYSAHAKIPKETKRTPDETRDTIVEIVRGRPGISQREVMEELGMERDDASYYLRELVKEGRLAAEKQGRYTVYNTRQ